MVVVWVGLGCEKLTHLQLWSVVFYYSFTEQDIFITLSWYTCGLQGISLLHPFHLLISAL